MPKQVTPEQLAWDKVKAANDCALVGDSELQRKSLNKSISKGNAQGSRDGVDAMEMQKIDQYKARAIGSETFELNPAKNKSSHAPPSSSASYLSGRLCFLTSFTRKFLRSDSQRR